MVFGGRGGDLGCGVAVRVVSQDRADPPNVLDQVLKTFEVDGRSLLETDTDYDCRVDAADLVGLSLRFGAQRGDPNYDSTYDFNGDGVIGNVDLNQLKSDFGKDTS
jgi:hypothetical protein